MVKPVTNASFSNEQPLSADMDYPKNSLIAAHGTYVGFQKSTKNEVLEDNPNFYFILSLSTKQTFKKSKEQLLISELGESGRGRQFYLGNNNICFCTNAIICYFRLHLY